MATDQRNLPAFLGDDATFRTWGSGIAAQLLATGLVKTGDTGQIDWATVLRPAAGAVGGYEIWRFDDALHAAGKTCHIKVEYGTSGLGIDRPALWITVGLGGTNGAGALNGAQVSTRADMRAGGAKPGGTLLPSYVSGANDRLSMLTNTDPANTSFGMLASIDRFKKADGTPTDEGVYMVTFGFAAGGSTSLRAQPVYYAGAIPASDTTPNALNPDRDLSNVGNAVFIAPHTIAYGEPRYGWPFSYKNADLAAFQPVSVTQFGAAHTFLPVGRPGNINWALAGATGSVAILWE